MYDSEITSQNKTKRSGNSVKSRSMSPLKSQHKIVSDSLDESHESPMHERDRDKLAGFFGKQSTIHDGIS